MLVARRRINRGAQPAAHFLEFDNGSPHRFRHADLFRPGEADAVPLPFGLPLEQRLVVIHPGTSS